MKNIYLSRRNLEQMLFLFLFVIHAFTLVNAQTLPNPLYEFPLNFDNPELWYKYNQGNKLSFQGEKGGSFGSRTDRFGEKGGAIFLNTTRSYITQKLNVTPEPLGSDMTVSFWTYLYSSNTFPPEYSPYDSNTLKERFFSLTTDQKSGGLARVRDNALLGVERTVTVNSTVKPWYLWLNKPAMMEQAGWYQIVMVAAQNYTKIYIYKPDGSKACSYNYMGNKFAKKITIGAETSYPPIEESVQSAGTIDDFKVWNVALTEEQVSDLHEREKDFDGGFYKIVNFKSQRPIYVDNCGLGSNGAAQYARIYQYTNPTEWCNSFQFVKRGVDSKGAYYQIINERSGYPIYVDNCGSGASGPQSARVYQYFDSGNEHCTYFYVDYIKTVSGKKQYKIINRNSGYPLYVDNCGSGDSGSQGARIYQYRHENVDCNLFQLEPTLPSTNLMDGTYRINVSSSDPQKSILTSARKWEFDTWELLGNKRQNLEIQQIGYNLYHIIFNGKYVEAIKGANGGVILNSSQSLTNNCEWYIFPNRLRTGYKIVNKVLLAKLGRADDEDGNARGFKYFDLENQTLDFIDMSKSRKIPETQKIEFEIRNMATNGKMYADNCGFGTNFNNWAPNVYQYNNALEKCTRWITEFVKLDVNGNPIYFIKHKNSGKLLYADNCGNNGNRTEVYLYTNTNDKTCNYFYINWSGDNDNSYEIVHQKTGRRVHLDGPLPANWTNIYLYEPLSNQQQAWLFNKTSNELRSNRKIEATLENEEEFTDVDISVVYPNPTDGLLNIAFALKEPQTINFDIYDMLGKKVYCETRIMSTSEQIITLENLKHSLDVNQLYILKATTANDKELLVSKVIFK